jgi:cardiolipin synthase
VAAADVLTLCRPLLGLAFVALGQSRLLALVVLGLAGLTDALDGPLARRRDARIPDPNRRRRGTWLDPLCDKLFMGIVVAGLVLTWAAPVEVILLLLLREQLQLVAFVIHRLVPGLRARPYEYQAHPVGKATTVAQFVTAGLLVLGHPAALAGASTSAGLGAVAVAIYVSRAFARPSQAR